MQRTFFDGNIPFTINKPLRLIEFFAGYGSQALALKYLGVKFEHYKICEWAIKSIQAYKDIHFENNNQDYSKDLSKDFLIDYLTNKGISSNYSEPMTRQQIQRLGEPKIRQVYNNIISTNNLVNIMQVKGSDLEIVDKDKYDYLVTYSFPCVTKDSLILTQKGYIEIKDIEVGDYVLTKSNTWQKVYKKFDNGIHQTCYINAMGFENIHCTLNHKFYVREMYRYGHKSIRKFKEPKFMEAKDLNKNHYFGIPVIKEENPFYTNDLDFWYMIGMYLGDGWLPKKGNEIVIACNDKKLKKLKDMLDVNKYNYTYSWNGTCYRLRFANKEIRNFIDKYIGTVSENKNIPYEIFCLPKSQLEMFYKGYLDSDGCIIENKHQFTSINKSLIYGISLIINKLYNRATGIYKIKVAPKKEIEGRLVNQKDWYQLRFKMDNNKQDKAFYENGYIWYPFKSRELAKYENVYNMEIENDHSYVLQGCISKNCQDLSKAGKQKGMDKNSGTRSGLLWEVERILNELNDLKSLPNILLMENVPDVIGTKNVKNFSNWLEKLESLGYKNYWNNLNAKEYGIPQNRERVFMISILGDYDYTFPQKNYNKVTLKDIREKNVDRKYYLSDKAINYVLDVDNVQKGTKWEGSTENAKLNKEIAMTIGCRSASSQRAGLKNFIVENERDEIPVKEIKEKINKVKLAANKILENNNIKDGEFYDVSYASARLDEIKNNKKVKVMNTDFNISPTLTTYPQNFGMVINENEINRVGYYTKSKHNASSVVNENGIAPTVMGNNCTVTGIIYRDKKNLKEELCEKLIDSNILKDGDIINHSYTNSAKKENSRLELKDYIERTDGISPTLTTRPDVLGLYDNFSIRKLTPKECFRLQGVKDDDFYKVQKNQSDASLYHLSGDSIAVNVLISIFSRLYNIDYIPLWQKIYENEIKEK